MKILAFASALLLTTVLGCAQNKKPTTENLSPKVFQEHIQKNEGIILDVRTPEEVANGKIKGSINMNVFDDFDSKINNLDKSKPIYVYCAAGGRSSNAMKKLNKAGFQEVYNLVGGFGAWKNAGLPTE